MIRSFFIEKPKEYLRQAGYLFRNPTSVYVAVLFAFQVGLLVVLSLIIPFFLRYSILPSSIQREIPLNLVFSPCTQDLHGVCSFPTAYLDVSELFSANVHYQISVKLHFTESETNIGIGLFQNELSLKSAEDNVVGHWKRTGLLKQPGWFTKTMWVLFFPFYFLGFFHNYYELEIPFAADYFAAYERPATTLTYSLQDRFAQLEGAVLLVNAKFGLIRHFVYYWPISSFMIIFLSVLLSGGFILAVYWGHKSYVFYRRTSESEQPATGGTRIATTAENAQPREPASTQRNPRGNSARRRQRDNRPADDEFIPDNVDEVPECPVLPGFPMWDVTPAGASPTNRTVDNEAGDRAARFSAHNSPIANGSVANGTVRSGSPHPVRKRR